MRPKRYTRRRFASFVGGVALTGLAGCFGTDAGSSDPSDGREGAATPTETPATDSTPTPEEADGVAVVEMITDNQGTYFDPKGLLVEPGTTVRFVNESGSHGSTAYHPDREGQPQRIPDAAQPWDSEIFSDAGRRYEVTLDVEGVYDYYCPPHESMGMVGRLIVGEPHDGPGTSPPDDLPPGAREALPAIAAVVDEGAVDGP